MDDELRLVRAMARRDRSAWDAMYDRHVGDVFAVIYHLVGGDRQAAEDLNQEVWLLAIEQFDRFDAKRGGFRDWLLGIARHRVFRHYRRATGQTVEGRPDRLSDDLPPPELLEGRERAEVGPRCPRLPARREPERAPGQVRRRTLGRRDRCAKRAIGQGGRVAALASSPSAPGPA